MSDWETACDPVPARREMSGRAGLLSKLAAAGIGGKRHRPLAEIARDIKVAEEVVRRLHRERKSAVNGAALNSNRHRPDVVEKRTAGIRRSWSDPEKKAIRIERTRETMRRSGWLLPEMTPEQRRRYNVLRQTKTRAEALAGVFGQ